MIKFQDFRGRITRIEDLWFNGNEESKGCYKKISVEKEKDNIVNFVVEPTTYFVEHAIVQVGDLAIGYYDANAPAILIYPPQYPAIVMAKDTQFYNVKVDYFDNRLVSSDGQLKLNIDYATQIILQNGQSFNYKPINRYLIVLYGPTTRSIPAQTIPYKIIVMCIDDKR